MSEEQASTTNYPPVTYEHLEAMYPEVYWRINPMVMRYTEMYDVPSNPNFYPYPNRAAVEQMADTIYQQVMNDPNFQNDRQGGGFLRALILILLIRQLLRRRYT